MLTEANSATSYMVGDVPEFFIPSFCKCYHENTYINSLSLC